MYGFVTVTLSCNNISYHVFTSLSAVIHLLEWILPVILIISLALVLCCALVLWRKHKRDKYVHDHFVMNIPTSFFLSI